MPATYNKLHPKVLLLMKNSLIKQTFQTILAFSAAGIASLAMTASHATEAPSNLSPEVRIESETVLTYTEIAFGLDHPWALAFLPQNEFLITELDGAMRIIDDRGRVGVPLRGVPAVVAAGEGGLLDVILDRNFAENRKLYFCYAEADPSSNRSSTALASATLSADKQALEHVSVIFHQLPRIKSDLHYGCRIAQAADDSLFLTLGERSSAPFQAQRIGNHLGKIVHILPDGSPHPDNPFLSTRTGAAEIWSWGHRNPQGLVITPDGKVWSHEPGPRGGDELNLIQRSQNYGWPLVTDGRNYGTGAPIGTDTNREGMQEPIREWTPSIDPSGMTYLSSDVYGADWKNTLIIGALKSGQLIRLNIDDPSNIKETRFTIGPNESIRDVRQGPDGYLYVLTDSKNGRLLRINPPEIPVVEEAPSAAPVTGNSSQVPAAVPTAR